MGQGASCELFNLGVELLQVRAERIDAADGFVTGRPWPVDRELSLYGSGVSDIRENGAEWPNLTRC